MKHRGAIRQLWCPIATLGERRLSFLSGWVCFEELADVRHIEQRFDLRVHCHKRQLPIRLLRCKMGADQGAQTSRIDEGNIAEINDYHTCCLGPKRRLKIENGVDIQGPLEP